MIKIGYENRNNFKQSTYFVIIYNVKAEAICYLNEYCKRLPQFLYEKCPLIY